MFSKSLLVVLLVGCYLAGLGTAAEETRLSVQVPAASEICFVEEVKAPESSIYLHFMVTLGGANDIDVTVTNPGRRLLWAATGQTEERALIPAANAGQYTICFSNKMSTVTQKVVSVLVDQLGSRDAKKASVEDKINRWMHHVELSMGEIRQLQDYLRVREREHRSTVEVANTRVIRWSIIEAIVIAGMGYFNVHILRRMFTTRRFV